MAWGSDSVVMASGGGGGPTSIVKGLFAALPAESVTRIVKLNVPCTPGVPDRRPSEVSVMPSGKVPNFFFFFLLQV